MAERGGGGSAESIAPLVIAAMVIAMLFWAIAGGKVREVTWAALRTQVAVTRHIAPIYPSAMRERQAKLEQLLAQDVPADITPGQLMTMLGAGGSFLVPPIGIVLLILGWRGMSGSIAYRYRRKLNFESLIRVQAAVYPRMRPVVHLQGRMTREQRGNFWWPNTPWEWAVRCGVIADLDDKRAVEASFNAGLATQHFGAQLGRAGAALPFHVQILVAAFAARIMDRKKDAAAILDDAAAGFGPPRSAWNRAWRGLRGTTYDDWPTKGPWEIRLTARVEKLMDGILSAIADPQNERGRKVAAILAQSHFVPPKLIRLLMAAQNTGIISSSDFIWLKAIDRTLFYALNDVGRQVACVEAAGIRAHVLAEDAHRKAGGTSAAILQAPHVEASVTALKTDLTESDWSRPKVLSDRPEADSGDAIFSNPDFQVAMQNLAGTSVALNSITARWAMYEANHGHGATPPSPRSAVVPEPNDSDDDSAADATPRDAMNDTVEDTHSAS